MLSRVTVESFKSIRQAELELGQVNVFIGANGVGKSNLLEAVGLLSAAASGRVDDEALMRRGVRLGTREIYRSAFDEPGADRAIWLEGASDTVQYVVGLETPQGQEGSAWSFASEQLRSKAQNGRTVRLVNQSKTNETGKVARNLQAHAPDSPARQLIQSLDEYRIYTPDTRTLRGLVIDPQQQHPIGLSGGRLAEAVRDTFAALGAEEAEAVRDSLGEMIQWMRDVDVVSVMDVPMSRSVPSTPWALRFRDRHMAPGHDMVSAYDASEGALWVLFTLVLSLHPQAPRLFAIDNADHALNPRLARRLMQALCGWMLGDPHRQALLTVHNPVALDGLPLQDDRVRLFAVDRAEPTGETVFHRVQFTEALLAKADRAPLSRLWVSGMLGGVPDV